MNRLLAACAGLCAALLAPPALPQDPEPVPPALYEGHLRAGRPAPLSLEAEHLWGAGAIHLRAGQAVAQDMRGFGSGWSHDAQLFVVAAGRTTRLAVLLPAQAGARYALDLYLTRAPDYGALRFAVDGRQLAPRFDGYAGTVRPAAPLRLGEVVATENRLTVELRVAGRNRRSSGYHAGVDRLVLVPLAQPGAGNGGRP